MKRSIQGAIFDMDGTLLDSMSYWRNFRVRFLEQRGLEATTELVDALQSMTVRESIHCLKTTFSLPQSEEEILADMMLIIRDFYERGAPVKSNAVDLLEYLKAKGVPMCIASATDEDLVELALQRSGLRHYFDAIFSTKTIGRSKKYPDIYRLAHAHLGTPKEATWVFEDALYALETASSDGFLTVGIYDEDEPRGDVLREKCDVYFPDYSVFDQYF